MLGKYFYLIIFLLSYSKADEKCNKKLEKPPHLKIKDHILCDYDKTIRPVLHNNATVLEVKFLVHHVDYIMHNGELKVYALFGMRWTDEHIHWDPDDFSGIETILLTTDDLWVPDLTVYNKGTYGSSQVMQKGAQCIVMYYKKIICVSQSKMSVMCTPDLRHYPFDVQNCTLRVGSWFHSGEEIDIQDTEIIRDIGLYEQHHINPDWFVESMTVQKDPGIYENYPNETYPSLDFVFVIRRSTSYKLLTLILPVLIIIGMTILTIWLEPTSKDRIYIIIANIPLHLMQLLNTQWDLPDTGTSVPYLVRLLQVSIFIILLTLLETIIVRYYLNKVKDTPRSLVLFFTRLASNKIGQLLLFSEINPENAAENLTADDSSNLVEMIEQRPKEWYLLGKVIDRLFFVAAILVYFFMFMLYIPKK